MNNLASIPDSVNHLLGDLKPQCVPESAFVLIEDQTEFMVPIAHPGYKYINWSMKIKFKNKISSMVSHL